MPNKGLNITCNFYQILVLGDCLISSARPQKKAAPKREDIRSLYGLNTLINVQDTDEDCTARLEQNRL